MNNIKWYDAVMAVSFMAILLGCREGNASNWVLGTHRRLSMDKVAADALRQTKACIENPEKWCQKAFALNGKQCLMQALLSTCHRLNVKVTPVQKFLVDQLTVPPGIFPSLTSYNDTHLHVQVMSLLNRAIEAAETPDPEPIKPKVA